MNLRFFLSVLTVAFTICVTTSCDSEKDKAPLYFDLASYFNHEIAHLDSMKPAVQKLVISQGKQEIKNGKDIIWKNEFQPFLECDLNKPAYRHAFVVDTVLGEQDYSVVYTARDSVMPVQFAMINFDAKNQVTKVNIKTSTRNKLYISTQTYNYVPNQSYSIETDQEVFLSGRKTNSVFSYFTK